MFKGAVVNRAFPSVHNDSLEITITVPLNWTILFFSSSPWHGWICWRFWGKFNINTRNNLFTAEAIQVISWPETEMLTAKFYVIKISLIYIRFNYSVDDKGYFFLKIPRETPDILTKIMFAHTYIRFNYSVDDKGYFFWNSTGNPGH